MVKRLFSSLAVATYLVFVILYSHIRETPTQEVVMDIDCPPLFWGLLLVNVVVWQVALSRLTEGIPYG